eukprot:CAMPEP_0198607528 /NCGR_PEP_ID=MMETSP1462-20131121/155442_1 /TAXON_ID=1333877 /ORGANISM="Brandtodinium nutriculum, Strain RCC3387" /LENGTH=257 /DNA_ID=CAMNT_0044339335 /DNA_START=27 /DNA_END=798 /DNA_ORIENTATION=-
MAGAPQPAIRGLAVAWIRAGARAHARCSGGGRATLAPHQALALRVPVPAPRNETYSIRVPEERKHESSEPRSSGMHRLSTPRCHQLKKSSGRKNGGATGRKKAYNIREPKKTGAMVAGGTPRVCARDYGVLPKSLGGVKPLAHQLKKSSGRKKGGLPAEKRLKGTKKTWRMVAGGTPRVCARDYGVLPKSLGGVKPLASAQSNKSSSSSWLEAVEGGASGTSTATTAHDTATTSHTHDGKQKKKNKQKRPRALRRLA